jgi:plastocyanin
MTVHYINITKEKFDPTSLTARYGDQVRFQLSERVDPANVNINGGTLFDGSNAFEVDTSGKEKLVISNPPSETQYKLSATLSITDSEVTALEQTGTMNGSITVIP